MSDKSYAGVIPYLFVAMGHAFYSAAFWSAIPYFGIQYKNYRYAVEEKLVGFTLGVMITLQNANSAFTTIISGVIRDHTQDYRKGYLFVFLKTRKF